MNDPIRWTQDRNRPPPAELARAIDESSQPLGPLSPAARSAVWRGVERRIAARAGFNWDWVLVPALACGLTLLFLALRLSDRRQSLPAVAAAPVTQPEPRPVSPAGTTAVAIGAIAQLEVAPGTVLATPPVGERSTAGYRMTLSSGKVCAHVEHRDVAHEGPFVVQAPDLKVVVIGTRFCVETAGDFTTVSVTEGRVRVERPRLADAFVAAGESLSSARPPTAAVAAPIPVVTPSVAQTSDAVANCGQAANLSRRANCYAGLVGSDDLTAQNALFSLALLSREGLHDGPAALSHLRTYLARFPDGALAPEAHQTLIAELFAENRLGETSTEADRYLARYPWDGRAAEIALLRAGLLRQNDLRRALAAYRDILGRGAPAAVRDDALYGAIVSGFDLGEVAQARVDLARYRSEFPRGKHAAEVEALQSR